MRSSISSLSALSLVGLFKLKTRITPRDSNVTGAESAAAEDIMWAAMTRVRCAARRDMRVTNVELSIGMDVLA